MPKDCKKYSDSLQGKARDLTLRVSARHSNSFVTLKFSSEGREDDEQWREARLSQTTNLWDVVQCQKSNKITADEKGQISESLMTKKEKILTGVCFFDALYACALYETAELQGMLNRKVVKSSTREGLGLNHYKAFAMNEGIVFDGETSLPLPVANGEVLAESFYIKAGDEDVIEKSMGNVLDNTIAPIEAHEILGIEKELVHESDKSSTIEAVTRSADRELIHKKSSDKINSAYQIQKKANRQATKSLEEANKKGCRDLVYKFNDSAGEGLISTGVKYSPLLFAGGLLLPVGIAEPIIALGIVATLFSGMFALMHHVHGFMHIKEVWTNNGLSSPTLNFKRKVRSLRKNIGESESPELKHKTEQFSDRLELAFQTLKTRKAFNRVAKGTGIFNRARLDRELNKLERLAQSKKMEQGDISALINSIRKNPGDRSFEQAILNKVREQSSELEQECLDVSRSQLKALPAPPP